MCGKIVDDAAAGRTRKRYETILERADSCELPDPDADNPSCNYAAYTGAKRGLGLLPAAAQLSTNSTARRSVASALDARALSRKTLKNFLISNDRYKLEFAQYARCGDARTDENILRTLIFQSSGRRCNTDVRMVANKVMKQTFPGLDLETDHVYEA